MIMMDDIDDDENDNDKGDFNKYDRSVDEEKYSCDVI